jgi:cytochrome c5
MRAALLLALFSISPGLAADSGEEVYREVCTACHSTKFDKAPQLGDRKAWAPLIEEGQQVLTAHGWVGVRNMPARGGKADLTLEAFSRAVAYMARRSGGKWQDPDAAMLSRIRTEVKKREAQLEKGK